MTTSRRRFLGTGFGDRITEIAIMTTAREMENQFEWTAHEVSGLKAGVEPTIVDIIKYRKPVVGLEEKETVVIKLGRELLGQKKVSAGTFADARRLFGNQRPRWSVAACEVGPASR